MKLPQLALRDLFWLVLVVTGIAVVWFLAPEQALKGVLQVVVLIAMLAFGLAAQAIYVRLRRPEDAEFFGMWKVPGGLGLVVAIVVIALCYLAYVITRDPLRVPR